MTELFIAGVFLVLVFSFVIAFGAPFLPTLSARTTDALDLLDLKPGQTLLELGSGDGRILRAAAERGIKSIGYELNPLLVLWSKLISWRNRSLITIKWGNYWRQKWPATDGIYVFLLEPYMKKLDKKITREIATTPKPAFEQSSKLRFGFLRRALLWLPLLSHRRRATLSSAAQPRLARHQNVATPELVKVVSFAFKIPGKRPVKENNGMFLYEYNKAHKH